MEHRQWVNENGNEKKNRAMKGAMLGIIFMAAKFIVSRKN